MTYKRLKSRILIFILILCYSFQYTAQTRTNIIPSNLIENEKVKPFIDSLKQKILSDTVKFNRKDLLHLNGRTQNEKPYSILITVYSKQFYSYRLDIVDNYLVKEFTDEILKSQNIKSIRLLNKENAPTLGGDMAKDGLIIITIKPKVKLNFKVGGLKYIKGKKKNGGNNFLQQKEGEIIIRT
ncbi:hypothetical protein BA768_18200 [Chryseobacterium sp. CBo1]|uniref:hypothetical protein n=1 Tax=Chryseobacterium sp. CBo1 TaxID=1869230 RepID=UPI000810888D|nr:hypothetical protein [Chryseobacterium sp. CBo1]OCK51096.1 hypothetical protein BA768_18200 [Chryseobacterium sp. CBo1]